MRPSECQLQGHIVLSAHALTPQRRLEIVRSVPVDFSLKYFSKNEFVRKTASRRIDNAEALQDFIQSGVMHHFHGDQYYLLLSGGDSGRHYAGFYSRDRERHVPLVESWMQKWTAPVIVYGYFSVPEEHEHRNGKSIRFSNTGSGGIYGLIGIDHERYLPGLYWLNVFSTEYVQERRLDVAQMALALGGRLCIRPWGYILTLYDHPAKWLEKKQAVDDYLFETPGCFSKRRADLPESVRVDEHIALILRLHKQWP